MQSLFIDTSDTQFPLTDVSTNFFHTTTIPALISGASEKFSHHTTVSELLYLFASVDKAKNSLDWKMAN